MKYFNNDIFSNPGSPIHDIYSPVVKEDGSIELEVTGKENTDDYIQSFLESCDINVIVSRIENGEVDLLNKYVGQYGDFSDMPKSYAEVLQLQIDSANLFNSLPIEIKQKFDNDANKFFAQSGTEEWYKNLGFVEKKNEESEVKVEE